MWQAIRWVGLARWTGGGVVSQIGPDLARAAGVEAAAGRRVGRARHGALEPDARAAAVAGPAPAPPTAAPRCRDGRAARTPPRPARSRTTLPEVHHRDRVGEVAHHAQVVGDEQHRGVPRDCWRSSSRLRIAACTETSSADTGSSQTTSSGSAGERAGDGDALLLAAAQLARQAVGEALVELDRAQQPRDRSRARPRREALAEPLRARRPIAWPTRVAAVERRVRVLEDHLDLAQHRRGRAARRRG